MCHGGPGIPSDYLFPLVEILQRPVIFFDQLGCGRSERPEPADQDYSIAASVRDLVAVIEALLAQAWIPLRDGRPAYHLYGQSFGGILAFETLIAAGAPPPPRTLTLSNVPSSVPVLLEEVAALLADLGGDGSRFEATHVCRLAPRPAALQAAYAPGRRGSHWRGREVIVDRCVSVRTIQGWHELPNQRLVVLSDVAQHALLKDSRAHGSQLEAFLSTTTAEQAQGANRA